MIEAVIFDLGGVLLRTEDTGPRTKYAKKLGMSRQELERAVFDGTSAVRATIGEITAAEHWENVRQRLELPHKEIKKLQDRFWGGDRLDSELVDYVRSLRGTYRTALLSNAWSDARDAIQDKFKIQDAFDELIISAEVHLAKPNPRIFQYAVDKLGVVARHAIFVDDFIDNVESAREFGLHAIQFKTASQTRLEVGNLLTAKR
jgi:epoxide hydrolase-like predicted phosphatase